MRSSKYLLSLLALVVLLALSGCNFDGDSVDGDVIDGDSVDGDVIDGDPVDGDKSNEDGDDNGDTSDGDLDTTTDPCDPDPCENLENKTCDPETGMCVCASNFCIIDDVCVADGASNPLLVCLYCDYGKETYNWSTRPAEYICRNSAGVCDTQEFCDGINNDCPTDSKLTSTCRESKGICDTKEICDGLNNDCPEDRKSISTCRESKGICDTKEICDGLNNDCPVDKKSTDQCRNSEGVCDETEFCDGKSDNCPADIKLTSICRPALADCDVSEFCNGIDNECPQNNYAVSGASCESDYNECTDDVCNNFGVCRHFNNDEFCDDSDDCTKDDVCISGTCIGTEYTCGNNGICNELDEFCECDAHYAGQYCDRCSASFVNYPDCDECALGFSGYPDCNTTGFLTVNVSDFWMGAPSGNDPCPEEYPPGNCDPEPHWRSNEGLRQVTLTYDFEMSMFEVTQTEFYHYTNINPSYNKPCSNCPVDSVNWYEALRYANTRSFELDLKPCYILSNCTGSFGEGCRNASTSCTSDTYRCDVVLNEVSIPQQCEGYRLPTEAEWEYAVRAGTQYTAFYQSPGNDGTFTPSDNFYEPNLIQIAHYTYNTPSPWLPQIIGTKEPNVLGLFDMLGNISEWVWDSYCDDTLDYSVDPIGACNYSQRIYRGGSAAHYPEACRIAFRYNKRDYTRDFHIGIRLVRTLH